jgi:hypothetical protein
VLVAKVTHPGGTLSTETAHLVILNAEVSHTNLQRLQTRATLEDIDKYLDDEIIVVGLSYCLVVTWHVHAGSGAAQQNCDLMYPQMKETHTWFDT